MDYYFDILRLLAYLLVPLLWAAYEHPAIVEVASRAWDLLRFIVNVVVTYFLAEHFLKRKFPPTAGNVEDAKRSQLEGAVRGQERAEAQRDAAIEELARERRETTHTKAESRDVLSPWRRRMLRRRGSWQNR